MVVPIPFQALVEVDKHRPSLEPCGKEKTRPHQWAMEGTNVTLRGPSGTGTFTLSTSRRVGVPGGIARQPRRAGRQNEKGMVENKDEKMQRVGSC